jgi:hypothetical protein
MELPEFDRVFDAEVVQALAPLGFVASGKSVHLLSGFSLVSLIRLAGRFSIPGSAVWTLCFRHTFLRELTDLRVVSGTGLATEHYPFKFTVSELMEGRTEMRYLSRLLHFDYDRFEYAGLDSGDVRDRLSSIAKFIGGRFVPWALVLSPELACEQIQRYGSGGWAEKIWIEDYERFMETQKAQPSDAGNSRRV